MLNEVGIVHFVLGFVLGHLCGSVPSGLWLVQALHGIDIRNYGSKNIGTTNVFRTVGPTTAVLVLVCDMLKGIIAVALVNHLFHSPELDVVTALGALLGHNYSVFLGFKGGKGVASMFGVTTVMSPISVPILAVPFFVTLSASKMVSLSSIISAVCVPVVTFVIYKFLPFLNPPLLRGDWRIPTVCTAIIAILVIFMHRSNIERIKKGEERKIGSKKG